MYYPSRVYPLGPVVINALILDFQALVRKNGAANEFIVRELAIEDLEHDRRESWVFQLPPGFVENYENKWVMEHHHGIPPDAGETPYDELNKILKEKTWASKYLFAKGIEKCKFLSKALGRDVLEVESLFNVPALKYLKPLGGWCSLACHQTDKYTCAVKNCSRLKRWICSNISKSRIFLKLMAEEKENVYFVPS
jgi:hypothetical protein